MQVAEGGANEELARKAVATIAEARNSDHLRSWLAGNSDGMAMDIKEALRSLGAERGGENAMLESLKDPAMRQYVFDNARESRPGEQQIEKAISAVEAHVSSGVAAEASSDRKPAEWPVGLYNIGNTCYFDSLLQYYFSIKPIREIVLNYDSYKLNATSKTEKVGHLAVDPVNIEGGRGFALALQRAFDGMIKEPTMRYRPSHELVQKAFLKPDVVVKSSDGKTTATPEQGGDANDKGDARPSVNDNVEARGSSDPSDEPQIINSLGEPIESREDSLASSQTLQGDDADVKMVDGMEPLPPPAQPPGVTSGDDTADGAGRAASAPPLPPRGPQQAVETKPAPEKPKSLQDLAEEKARDQQDVAEVHDNIINRLRAGMKAKGKDEREEQQDELRDLYDIRIAETTLDNGGQPLQPVESWTSSVLLAVPQEDTDIYSALDDFFGLRIRGDDKATQKQVYTSVVKAPPLLQINIPRGFFEKGKGQSKSDKLFRLEEELYVDRYLNDARVLPKRRLCWGWRKELHDLKQEEKGISVGLETLTGPSVIAATADYLNIIKDADGVLKEEEVPGAGILEEVDVEGLQSTMTSEVERLKARLAELREQIEALEKKYASEFDGEEWRLEKYRLAAVFMHRGGPRAGHYWICIHDFERNMWRSYNDEDVKEVKEHEVRSKILEARKALSYENEPTPTYVVYVRDEKKEELVNPVCRQPEEVPQVQVQEEEVEMSNADDWSKSLEPAKHVDPKWITEGGTSSWDTPRQVVEPGAGW
jgi:ubiquitin carboxyl-terminal hydrolase 25